MSESQGEAKDYTLVERSVGPDGTERVEVIASLPQGADPSGVFDAFANAEQREPGD